MYVLGINAYHGDAAACLLEDGAMVAAAEEERFRRVKHWAGFPSESIRWVLRDAGIGIGDVEHAAISRKPSAHIHKKILFALKKRPTFAAIRDRLANAGRVFDVEAALRETVGEGAPLPKLHWIEHHRSHLASAFLVSPFEEAALLSIDGFGDFVSAMWGTGRGSDLKVDGWVEFPHSLGLLYTAITQFLGFPKYGDEYKVMGLAAFGEPDFLPEMRRLVHIDPDGGGYELELDYFAHHSQGVEMTWENGEPILGEVFTEKVSEVLGPARRPDEPLEPRHEALAASLQAIYEEGYFALLRALQRRTGMKALCLAGGCAMNSVANGKVFAETDFTDIYVQAAAGDAGTALGAAALHTHRGLGLPRDFVMRHCYWGPEFGDAELAALLDERRAELEAAGCRRTDLADEDERCRWTAERIAGGKIVGWFQGRMEWGPRALGNRSIVADPRNAGMRDVLNARIKRREPFRPFAPSILAEAVGDWFVESYPDPFMIKVYPIRPEKREEIPAVTHVDGTGRLQTVDREENPLYWRLIRAFGDLTGVPIVLNTSFNENEPIVCTPAEALDCFLRTRMDVLVMGPFAIERTG